MANIGSKQKWVKTGRTFSAPYRLCDDEIIITKHLKEVIIEVWEMDKSNPNHTNWENGTWATTEKIKLRIPRKKDVIYS